MRTTFACVMVITVAWAPIGSGQELLWQGSVEDGTVQVIHNALNAKRDVGIPETGLPLTISRWNPEKPGYACRFFLLNPTGELIDAAGEEGDFFNLIPSPARGTWLVAGSQDFAAKAGTPFVRMQDDLTFGRRWQLDIDRFAVRAGDRTYVADAETGDLTMLAPDAGFIEILAADNGRIAMTGIMEDGLIMVRVYEADGSVLHERISTSVRESLRYLNMDAAGTFVEYSLGTVEPLAGKGMKFNDRVRVKLDDGAEQHIEIPLPGGRLKDRGHDFEIWTTGDLTIVRRLDENGLWTHVADHPQHLYFGRTMPEGKYLLAFGDSSDMRTAAIYDRDGDEVLVVPNLGNVFSITRHDAGIVVVHALRRTTVLSMTE